MFKSTIIIDQLFSVVTIIEQIIAINLYFFLPNITSEKIHAESWLLDLFLCDFIIVNKIYLLLNGHYCSVPLN